MVNRHRRIGWEYLHVAVDDATRPASTEILPDERKTRAIAFLERVLAWLARPGVTDNGLSQPWFPQRLCQRLA